MTGTWLYFSASFTMAFTKDSNRWWYYYSIIPNDWAKLKAAVETGAVWNKNLWKRRTTVTTSWPPQIAPGNDVITGVWGACPYAFSDSIVK
jgi:hypothetical protein